MRVLSVVLALTTVAWAAPLANAQDHRSLAELPALADLPERWRETMDLLEAPGMAVVVVKDGETYIETFGIRDPVTEAPVTPDTMFYIASVTKTYTASAVCALAEAGQLSLDDRVQAHLPRFLLPDADLASRVTVKDLLCHGTGVSVQPLAALEAFSGDITDDRCYYWLERADVANQPRYSNIHYAILGRVIRAVTGEPWQDALTRLVLEPAGLTRTTPYMSEARKDPDFAVPMYRDGDVWREHELQKNDRTMHAAGGLVTTARDAARWLRLHLNGGRIDGRRVLSHSMTQAMQSMHGRLAEPRGGIRIVEGYGYGWQVGRFVDNPLIGHGGGYIGTSAYIAMLPEQNVGLAVLVNAAGPARAAYSIAFIDLFERFTGDETPSDVYAAYVDPGRRREAYLADRRTSGLGLVDPASLSRPVEFYEGAFMNEHWGSLTVEQRGDGLLISYGSALQFVVHSRNDGFELRGFLGPSSNGRFLVAESGRVDAVEIVHPRYGRIVFHR